MTTTTNTYLEYVSRINRVIDYISNHLSHQLSVAELANVACFSEFHFQRIFSLVAGESLNGYVRRMRLERAAMMLAISVNKPVTDIALELGFSSSANFSKAFKAHFGRSPSEVRKVPLQSNCENSRNGKLNSMDGKLNSMNGKDKADFVVDYRNRMDHLPDVNHLGIEIKSLPPLHVAYVRTLKGYAEEAIQKAWDTLMNWSSSRGLIHDGTIALGIEHDDPALTGIENCRYDACITIPETLTQFQGEIGIHDLPGGIYVVHKINVVESMHDTMHQGYEEIFKWIAENGLSPSNSPSYTLYLNAMEMKQGVPGKLSICVKVDSLYATE